MDKKMFWTRIKGDHKVWGNSEFVKGVIVGIQYIICGSNTDTHMRSDEETGDVFLSVRCTTTLYQVFVGAVEKRYPKLCEFDVHMKKEG